MVDEGEKQVKDGPKECGLSPDTSRRVRSFRKKKDLIRKIITLVLYPLNSKYLQVNE